MHLHAGSVVRLGRALTTASPAFLACIITSPGLSSFEVEQVTLPPWIAQADLVSATLCRCFGVKIKPSMSYANAMKQHADSLSAYLSETSLAIVGQNVSTCSPCLKSD